jgi:hypothetical protein
MSGGHNRLATAEWNIEVIHAFLRQVPEDLCDHPVHRHGCLLEADDFDLGAYGQVLVDGFDWVEKDLEDVPCRVLAAELRLAMDAAVEGLAVDAPEAWASDTPVADVAHREEVPDACSSQLGLRDVKGGQPLALLNSRLVLRRARPIEFVTTALLLIPTMVILPTHHAVAPLCLLNGAVTLRAQAAAFGLPSLITLKLPVAGKSIPERILVL